MRFWWASEVLYGRDKLNCLRAILLILPIVSCGWVFFYQKRLAWLGHPNAESVVYAEKLQTITQSFRLVPDNISALATKHFEQAKIARNGSNLVQAQIEIEKAVSYAELTLSKTLTDLQQKDQVSLLQQYYQMYLDVLLKRHHQQPEDGFASRAWEVHDRLCWLLSNQSEDSIKSVTRMVTLTEVQQKLLDEQSLLLEYALGNEHSYLWAITKVGFACFVLPGQSELEPKARRLLELVSNQPEQQIEDPNNEFEILARELSDWLLKPVAAQMGMHRVLIVAEGVLQQLPFSALPVPDADSNLKKPDLEYAPLISKHEIINLPAAATGIWLRQRHESLRPNQKDELFNRSIAIIADPVFGKYDERVRVQLAPAMEKPSSLPKVSSASEGLITRLRNLNFNDKFAKPDETQDLLWARLPAARTEANTIAALTPRSVKWLDFEASRSLAFSGKLATYSILHFATMGYLILHTLVWPDYCFLR